MALDQDSDPITLAAIRELALSFPGVSEGFSYGTPALRVRGKLLARVHDKGEALVMSIDIDERAELMESDPVTFYITDHYRQAPWVLVRFATASREEVRALFERAWRKAASKKLIEAYDNG